MLTVTLGHLIIAQAWYAQYPVWSHRIVSPVAEFGIGHQWGECMCDVVVGLYLLSSDAP